MIQAAMLPMFRTTRAVAARLALRPPRPTPACPRLFCRSMSTNTATTEVSPLTIMRQPKVLDRLGAVTARVAAIQDQLSSERDPSTIATLSRELSELSPLADEVARYQETLNALDEVRALLDDPDMRALAQDEHAALTTTLADAAHAVVRHLLPKDLADEASAVLEVRAGAGGSEAALFAGELLAMYEKHAERVGWRWEVAHMTPAEHGGVKDAAATIAGAGVFRALKFESGVHRVQRVPATEAQGRIHTSTVTVAVLPLPEQVDQLVEVPASEIRVDVYRASGAGGQHVNKTESAVRITHLPTGIVVAIQDERSQHKNKAKAMKILRAKLYDLERQRADMARRDARRVLIGTGDRSERIRTYNFPQGRVTDHRVGLTLHDLLGIVSGERLGVLLDELAIRAEIEQMARVVEGK
ncbi:hypothetical protein GGF32_000188 [Allomyces javanicus]|nr:hypothetical protein GGF32_000188 [Allomyces javanicus]